uniref:ATP-binding cassette, sub-family D (ALD), member 3a n=1 Tax=Cyprinodon variegatus TaxID=28743 RepID=A0A3Q2CX80_CYPVA
MLVARTYCDVWMIQNGTMIESAIIGRSTKDFKIFLFSFIKFMPVIALVNNFLKLGLNELKLRFRERLTKKLYDQYLQGFTYYKMGNLDNRIANPDQLLTQDVEKFCNSVVDLYSNLSKPLLDIILYIFKLTSAIGAQGPAIMMSYLLISGLFLTRLRRPIGKMTVTEQRYEGEYRYVNSRLITNSEEIAFYNGNLREKQTIHATFKKLVSTTTTTSPTSSTYRIGKLKYKTDIKINIYRSNTENSLDLGLNLSLEIYGEVLLNHKEIQRLFTARITELMTVLKELNAGKYERTMVSQHERAESPEKSLLVPGSGQVINRDNIIKFDHTPLATPNGDLLIRDLSFEVRVLPVGGCGLAETLWTELIPFMPVERLWNDVSSLLCVFKVRSGTNVLVCGPNGCGKSSLFRVLGEVRVFGFSNAACFLLL